MTPITSLEDLSNLYGTPAEASTAKVAKRLTPGYLEWIMTSCFCVLSTVGPDGTDASPRGDDGPVVRPLNDQQLAMPDWRGNDRIDSLRNIVTDGRVSLMFMVPGSRNVIRVNGTAIVTADPRLRKRFERRGILPRTIVIISICEIYFQCARAIMRSAIWSCNDESDGLPTPGDLLAEVSSGQVGGAEYDAAWPARAAKTMW